jgi:hypothetical protein
MQIFDCERILCTDATRYKRCYNFTAFKSILPIHNLIRNCVIVRYFRIPLFRLHIGIFNCFRYATVVAGTKCFLEAFIYRNIQWLQNSSHIWRYQLDKNVALLELFLPNLCCRLYESMIKSTEFAENSSAVASRISLQCTFPGCQYSTCRFRWHQPELLYGPSGFSSALKKASGVCKFFLPWKWWKLLKIVCASYLRISTVFSPLLTIVGHGCPS